MKGIIAVPIVFVGVLFLSGCMGGGVESTRVYESDIKNDFCGPVMDFKYCKCAFHGEFCDDIKMSKKEADDHVQAEFKKWEESEIDAFAARCKSSDGIFTLISGDAKCDYCAEGYRADHEDRSCQKIYDQ